MSRFDVDLAMYIVRRVVFHSDDTMSDGDYVFVLADRSEEVARKEFERLREAGEWAEITVRRITERRVDQTHETMVEEF